MNPLWLLTVLFIVGVLAAIVIYDIWCVINGVTISRVMHEWYKQFPFTPYAAGVIFLGHFGMDFQIFHLPANTRYICLFIISALILGYSLLMKLTKWQFGRKLYYTLCSYSIIPALFGWLVGSQCWLIELEKTLPLK